MRNPLSRVKSSQTSSANAPSSAAPPPPLTTSISTTSSLSPTNSNNINASNGGSDLNKSISGKMKSRNASPSASAKGSHANGSLILKVNVLKGRDLAAKDRSGSSDPYLVLSLGDSRQSTSPIYKNLNPEWNTQLDFAVSGPHSILLEVVCWDKDRFGKDYMGGFDIPLDEIFVDGSVTSVATWYPLESKRTGRKRKIVTGEVLLEFSLVDPLHSSATPLQLLQRLHGLLAFGTDTPDEFAKDSDGGDGIATGLSGMDDDAANLDDDDDETADEEALDDMTAPEAKETRRRRKRLAKLKRRVKQRAYEFSGLSPIAGVLFIEISRVTDLPPEKNMTRTSWDMDPFVVTSLGKKTYRTRVIRHDRNPVYDEKLLFQVLGHETQYSLSFTVVDRDKLSKNDYIGAATLPLETISKMSPEKDPNTGLYILKEPEAVGTAPQEAAKRSRFRLPLSRSSSSTNVKQMSSTQQRPVADKQSSSASLQVQASLNSTGASTSGTATPETIPEAMANLNLNTTGSADSNKPSQADADLATFTLPLTLKHKERWEGQHKPLIHIRAKYLPYKALRQQFWRALIKQYDSDDNGSLTKLELTTMLDTLGSTLHESTIDSFFKRFDSVDDNGEPSLTYDQTVICLEDILERYEKQQAEQRSKSPPSNTSDSRGNRGGFLRQSTWDGSETSPTIARSKTQESQDVETLPHEHHGSAGEEGLTIDANDLGDDSGAPERVIEIQECPICHQPRMRKRSDADIITHIATCASQDWRQVNNLVMAGFVTSSQAQRKWYSKVITKIGYGGYKLGANSANILVQDRLTGQINEERMSVYVRLGIRLLYKGLGSRDMETRRIRKLLRSMSFKQGRKYDDPASAAEIQSFINFHQLDMNEVLKPIDQFKNFNEFFYRALKPDARPCSAPERPEIITSPADCRSVVFNKISEAQKVWVKGREFTVERLLGDAYPEDAKRYAGGALGVFRLAPQDYHRFHIPVDGTMGEPRLIDGEYYTVNPMAIRSALDVYGENIRVLVPIDSVKHGRVMVVCVGAMMVGSTVITRKPGEHVKRAEELGYFKFGGSTILLLFEPGVMTWDQDLLDNAAGALETLIRVGMSVGHSPGHAPHTPDMRKSQDEITQQDKEDAMRRIEGSLAPDGNESAKMASLK